MSTNCKFYKEEEYRSIDGGITWTAMGVYRKGDLIEYDSEDCGYVPPTPTGNTKFSASYSGGETYSVDCDSDTTLTRSTTKPSGYNYSAMTEAIIGDCVTSIGAAALSYCRSLTSIAIPSSVTSIGGGAFGICTSLTSVTIPDSVTSIDIETFEFCTSLTSVTIPSGVTTIGNYAFYGCSGLTSVTVDATTPPTLGSNVFDDTNNCPIYVPCASVSAYKAATNWSTYASRIQGIPPCSEPTPTGGTKFSASYNNGTSYSTECDSDTTLTSGITRPIGYQPSEMTNAVIGDCINSIGGRTFYFLKNGINQFGVSLTSVTIPTSVTSIGGEAFRECSGLTSITIPDSVTSIGLAAFEDCINLTSITIPSGVTNIGNYVFYDCISLTSCTLSTSITTISIDAFQGCSSLPNIIIPDSVTTIGDGAFNLCSGLTSVTIPSGVTYIGTYAFGSCSSLSSIDIPSGVTTIREGAFRVCTSLTSVTIPDNITSIGWSTFERCSSLPSIDIPSSVTSIGDYAFSGCTSLTSVTVEAITPPTLGNNVFVNTNNCPIYVPCESVDTYKAAYRWSTYASRIQCIPTFAGKFKAEYSDGTSYSAACDSDATLTTATTIPRGYKASEMTEAVIGDCINSIGERAFYSIGIKTNNQFGVSLTSVTIPNSVTSIGSASFSGCTNLSSVTIPSGVTSIDTSAFAHCSSLTSVTIPDSVTSIEAWTFMHCGIRSLTIGSGVTSIGLHAFASCTSLPSVTIPDSVTTIGELAFNYCTSITSVTIGSNVTSIGQMAFWNCYSLPSIDIPSSVTSIGQMAFWDCSGLTSVTCLATTPPTLGRQAFDNTNNCPIYVPCESVDAYKSAENWSTYASRITCTTLPYDAEIEYLESTGTQYINTGVYLNTSNFEIGCSVADTYCLWGYCHQNVANGTWLSIECTSSQKTAFFGRFGSNYMVNMTSYIQSSGNTFVYKQNGITVNGTIISKSLSIGSDSIANVPLIFFGRYDFNKRGVEWIDYNKFKSFYVKNNNELVVDMIPVRVGQVGYMYDRVSGQLFGNSGSGSFVLGADKT